MKSENVEKKDGFNQVCVWEGTLVGPDKIKEFEDFIMKEFETQAQYLEEISTLPDQKNGNDVEGTGGRNDLFFAIHDEDISKFAVPRIEYGIRWIEDVLAPCNYHSILYPDRVRKY